MTDSELERTRIAWIMESSAITVSRDALLPKLICGELLVGTTGHLLEETA